MARAITNTPRFTHRLSASDSAAASRASEARRERCGQLDRAHEPFALARVVLARTAVLQLGGRTHASPQTSSRRAVSHLGQSYHRGCPGTLRRPVLTLGACSSDNKDAGPNDSRPAARNRQAVFVNGDFETGDLTGWTKSTGVNNGLLSVPPANRAALNIGIGGQDLTFVLDGATRDHRSPRAQCD